MRESKKKKESARYTKQVNSISLVDLINCEKPTLYMWKSILLTRFHLEMKEMRPEHEQKNENK